MMNIKVDQKTGISVFLPFFLFCFIISINKCCNAQSINSVQYNSVSDLKMLYDDRSKVNNETNNKNSFIAIFKDSLLVPMIEPTEEKEKNMAIDIVEKEIRMIVARDSLISLNTDKDLIFSFDTTIDNRRCYGTIFCGPTLANEVVKQFSKNIIYFYSTSDIHISRLINGLFIYNSEDSNWEFKMKTEPD